MIFNFNNKISDVYDYIDSNIDSYFKKSGDSIDCFMDCLPGTKFAVAYKKGSPCGWIQYKYSNETMIIISAYNHSNQKRSFSNESWKEFKDFAKSKGCTKIRMKTMRNHKIMKRLYNFKTVERIMETQL